MAIQIQNIVQAHQPVVIPREEENGGNLTFATVYLIKVMEFQPLFGGKATLGRVVRAENVEFKVLFSAILDGQESSNFCVGLVRTDDPSALLVDSAIQVIQQNPVMTSMQEEFAENPLAALEKIRQSMDFANQQSLLNIIMSIIDCPNPDEELSSAKDFLKNVAGAQGVSSQQLEEKIAHIREKHSEIQNLKEVSVDYKRGGGIIDEEFIEAEITRCAAFGLEEWVVRETLTYVNRYAGLEDDLVDEMDDLGIAN